MKKKILLILVSMVIVGLVIAGSVDASVIVTHNEDENISYILNGNENFVAGTITITDGMDTITILDRNLGARVAGTGCKRGETSSCLASDPTYGYHFQWGNNYGFNPSVTPVTGLQITTSIEYNPFYSDGIFRVKKQNWIKNNSRVDLWGGSVNDYSDANDGNWQVTNPSSRRGPCPEKFHVPSYGELSKITSMMGYDGNKVHNDLLIPFAGDRNYYDTSLNFLGYSAYLGSSSPESASSKLSHYLYLDAGGLIDMYNRNRANALSIRCVYDFYEPYSNIVSSKYTITYDYDGGDVLYENLTGYDINTPDFMLNNPQKRGFVFDHWELNGENVGKFVVISQGTTGDKNFVAVYTPLSRQNVGGFMGKKINDIHEYYTDLGGYLSTQWF